MRAEVVSMTADNLDMEAIRRGGDILKQGGLVAFPTETVYGLGGDALNPQASMKIYAAKGRPSDNPLIVHIAEFDKLAPIVTEVPEKAKILAEKYWPGPLTMIFPKKDIVPYGTTGGLDTVAVRMPVDPVANCLIWYRRRLREVWTVWLFVFRVTGSRRNLSRQQVVMWLRPVPTLREDQARLLHSM